MIPPLILALLLLVPGPQTQADAEGPSPPADLVQDEAGQDEAGQGEPDRTETAPPPPPPPTRKAFAKGDRIIVRMSRRAEIPGYVELDDDEVIVIRKLDNELTSFPKSRVLKITPLVTPEPGQRGRVALRNGQFTEGIIIEDSFEQVVANVEGIRIRFKRADVEQVNLEPTFRQRYEEFKRVIQPHMVELHLRLCRWLVDERQYELASTELTELLTNNPGTPEAMRLRNVVNAQLALQATERKTRSAAPAPETPAGIARPIDTQPDRYPTVDADDQLAAEDPGRSTGPVNMADMLPDEILTRDEVNLMRVYEIDFNRPPKVAIQPDTIRRLLEEYGHDRRVPTTSAERTALFHADPLRLTRMMFELRARNLYTEVEVLGEPYSLNLFRQKVHNTWLIQNCATSRCHGSPFAGRFFLHRLRYKDDRVRYTNFLILERLVVDPEWPLINYESPTDSLIIQYGLPREGARKPHPRVKGWKPVFTKGNLRMLDGTVLWIESMMKPRPQYPVDYEPPELSDRRPGEPDRTSR